MYKKHSFHRVGYVVLLSVLAIVLNSTLAIAGYKLSNAIQHENLWAAITDEYRLTPQYSHAAVTREIHWYTGSARNRVYVQALSENARPYLYYVYQQVKRHHMPAEVALLPMVESNYQPFNYSTLGATGLWQMMPGTASGLGVHINWWYDGRRDIRASTQAALQHLQDLHHQFHDWLLAIAAYNCGAGAVWEAIHYNQRHHLATNFWALHLPKQTKNYVPKLLALATIFKHPTHYHVLINPVPNEPYFTTVNVKQALAITQVAKLADASTQLVRQLNPGFRRWSTNPKQSSELLLPIANADIFEINDNSLKKPRNWINYHVKRGQNLSVIASAYHTSIEALKRVNHLDSNEIFADQKLMIPNAVVMDERIKNANQITEDNIPGPKSIIHTVNSKETLRTIAHHYKVTPDQIRYWNELGYRDKPKPQQKLIIWQ